MIAAAFLALTAAILLTSAVVVGGATTPEATDSSPQTNGQPRFATLPPGSTLPSDAECAAKVRRSDWEPRSQNHSANHTVPDSVSIPAWDGVDSHWNTQIMPRVTGNFTGTTDEIIQWGACKWGFDEDNVRAVAVGESNWHMSQLGDDRDDPDDCAPGYSAPCPTSFGIMQVKWTAHPGTHPLSELSTAFNVDYALAVRRGCFEGYETWLGDYGDYRAGDEWGCIGRWYSGRWHDADGDGYISRRRADLADRAWEQPGF
ncbi:MAG: hypothetical protein H0V05_00860 [Euzebyaceae bacterium]|jgi:autotransporter family porin|nr:hypothetical protein [Euzebyaceae bacterium]